MSPLSLPWFFMVVSLCRWEKLLRSLRRRSVMAAATVLRLMAFLDQLAFALATLVAAHLAGLADAHVALVAALGPFGVLRVAIVLLLLAHLLAPVMDRGPGPSSVPRALFGLAAGADQLAHALPALAAGFADGG